MIPEEQPKEVVAEQVVNFLSKVVEGDNVEAGQYFSDLMVSKINDALAKQKVEVAKSMFSRDASVVEEANEEEAEEIAYISQEQYDELPEDEKSDWDKLPEAITVEDTDIILEYQRGLWRPPSDVNKTTGVQKTPRAAVARTVAKSPVAKPAKVKRIKNPKKGNDPDRLDKTFSMPAPKKGS